MPPPNLIGLGEILWDLLPTGKQPGGAPANFACHATALGGRGVVVSRVGSDPLGREILARLNALSLDLRHLQIDPNHPTGTVDVRLDDKGVPEYVIHRDVAWDHLDFTPELAALAAQADAVCFGTLAQRSPASGATINAFLKATRPNCLRVFDINLRQQYFTPDLIASMLDLSTVLKLNDAELPIVAELLNLGDSEPQILKNLFARFPVTTIALTRGPQGSSIFTAVQRFDQPPTNVRVIDTVGAGDAFTAALALGICANVEMEKLGIVAARAAAYVCTQSGATPPMPPDLQILSE